MSVWCHPLPPVIFLHHWAFPSKATRIFKWNLSLPVFISFWMVLYPVRLILTKFICSLPVNLLLQVFLLTWARSLRGLRNKTHEQALFSKARLLQAYHRMTCELLIVRTATKIVAAVEDMCSQDRNAQCEELLVQISLSHPERLGFENDGPFLRNCGGLGPSSKS